MADNGNGNGSLANDNASQGGDGNNVELMLAIAAMVISVAAFIVSILQALQQYYSSARGYSSCGPAVIGKWAKSRRRILRWYEFRFEVRFEVPVIFVARASNQYGPMGHTGVQKIVFLDGSDESYKDSWTQNMEEHDQASKKQRELASRIHTADNEAATWLGLLMAVQRMEVESRNWQGEALRPHGIAAPSTSDSKTTWPWPPTPYGGHSLIVCLQKKKKSWDTIPDNVTKPYATTTIAHLVEFTALLGIYWKVFDRSEDRYLAQGNGFILSGSNVEGLGLTFSFQKKGPTWFKANRVVPHYDVKELCFGFCPTTFRPKGEKQYADESRNIGTLQLGSMDEIAETLVVLGCNARTVNYFRDGDGKARFSHLFPIAFELLGMIGITFQVKGTVFRMLPNPSVFRWDPKSFDLKTLLSEYGSALSRSRSPSRQSDSIQKLLKEVLDEFRKWDEAKTHSEQAPLASTPSPKPTDKQASSTTHDVEGQIGAATTRRRFPFMKQDILVGSASPARTSEKPAQPLSPGEVYSPGVFKALHDAIEASDAYLKPLDNRANDTLLRLVLRSHLHSVLGALNKKPNESGNNVGSANDLGPGVSNPALVTGKAPTIQDIDATTDRKHALFMRMYFETIRDRVLTSVHGRVRRMEEGKTEKTEPEALEQDIKDIWDTLFFRMLCWLLLHHFHVKDVQVSKSDVYESRMPVYIV